MPARLILVQPPARPPAAQSAVSRDSEEIQIHIGRIEVIAVSAAAPRPSPQRRIESLDDYLRRHDRRPR
jgi:hypothetical protein